LTPEAIETLLQDFRVWLQETAQADDSCSSESTSEPEFQWQTLVAEFTALRQEVNLQTRAARAQMEQSGEALKTAQTSVAALEEHQPDEQPKTDETIKPFLKTLTDLYDAMALAMREVGRVQKALDEALAGVPAIQVMPKRRWWRFWSGPPPSDQDKSLWKHAAEQVRGFFESVVTGYKMGLERLDRAFTQHGLETIDCVGEPFDPEYMEVVDVVTEPGRTGTEVLEVVRRGYLWNERLFRPAQVRVARP
jgi:molecular chaperone GrpE